MLKKLPEQLCAVLLSLPKIALAFSGGIDSRFLAHAALLCGCDVLAINVAGPHIPASDTLMARKWASERNLPLLPLDFNPLPLPQVRSNAQLRCYECKRSLFRNIKSALADFDLERQICDGSNFDDLQAYRPGLKALKEAEIISPLAESGLTKAEIRELAKNTGLDFYNQPSRPCLLTRLNYGISPTEALLSQIETCEAQIREKYGEDLEFRLRLLPEPLLQIAADIESAGLMQILRQNGFGNTEIHRCAAVSGFFDANSSSNPVRDNN